MKASEVLGSKGLRLGFRHSSGLKPCELRL